jgi:hypothetical protein
MELAKEALVTHDGYLVTRAPSLALVSASLQAPAAPVRLSRPDERVFAFEIMPDGQHLRYLSGVAEPFEWVADDAPEMQAAVAFGLFMANYDGPQPRRGVLGMIRTVRSDGSEWTSLGCRATPPNAVAKDFGSFTEPCELPSDALRAALRTKAVPPIGACSSAREAFAHCVAAIQRADVAAFRRCRGLPPSSNASTDQEKAKATAEVGLPMFQARQALVRWLGAADPAVVAEDPSGAVRFRDPRGEEHTMWLAHRGCQWHLAHLR